MESENNTPVVKKDASLTPTSDKKGITVCVCAVEWFDERKIYKIANAPERTAKLEFTGSDLNFVARVLYAEASGSAQLADKTERDNEKAAIMNVNHFRLNRRSYPSSDYLALNFRMVCEAPGQFESVYAKSPKFLNSTKERAESLSKSECADLEETIQAVRVFMENEPNDKYQFENSLAI